MASWSGTTLCEPFSRLGGKRGRAWNLPCQKGDTPLGDALLGDYPFGKIEFHIFMDNRRTGQ